MNLLVLLQVLFHVNIDMAFNRKIEVLLRDSVNVIKDMSITSSIAFALSILKSFVIIVPYTECSQTNELK